MRINFKRLAVAVLGGATIVGSSAFAADDYSGMLAGLETAAAVTAILGAGAIYAGPGFAKWATKKVAGFFG